MKTMTFASILPQKLTIWYMIFYKNSTGHYFLCIFFDKCRGEVIGPESGPGYMCSPAPAVLVCSFVLRFNEGYAAQLTSKHPIRSPRIFLQLFFYIFHNFSLPTRKKKFGFRPKKWVEPPCLARPFFMRISAWVFPYPHLFLKYFASCFA